MVGTAPCDESEYMVPPLHWGLVSTPPPNDNIVIVHWLAIPRGDGPLNQ